MDFRATEDTDSWFVAYVEGLMSMIGHADQAGPLRDHCTGFVTPYAQTFIGIKLPRLGNRPVG